MLNNRRILTCATLTLGRERFEATEVIPAPQKGARVVVSTRPDPQPEKRRCKAPLSILGVVESSELGAAGAHVTGRIVRRGTIS